MVVSKNRQSPLLRLSWGLGLLEAEFGKKFLEEPGGLERGTIVRDKGAGDKAVPPFRISDQMRIVTQR